MTRVSTDGAVYVPPPVGRDRRSSETYGCQDGTDRGVGPSRTSWLLVSPTYPPNLFPPRVVGP